MKYSVRATVAGFVVASIAAAASAQTLTRSSISSSGVESIASGGFLDGSFYPSVSDDGRYVVFQSNAGNLIDGESTTGTQIYLRDRRLGLTTLVSRSLGGTAGNGTSELAKISGDGTAVVFQSAATDLVSNDTNASIDVFVWQHSTGQITRASVDSFGAEGNSNSADTYGPSISADGRYVAFSSTASNLVSVAGGGFNRSHIYRFDRLSNNTIRVSVVSGTTSTPGNQLSTTPTISGDGDKVAFRSAASNLITGDTNAINDVFVRTISTNSTSRVSLTSANGQITAGTVAEPAISRDGTAVVFTHTGNLTGTTTSQPNVYLRQLSPAGTTRISNQVVVTSAGGCYTPTFSGNGNFIAFSSWDAGLVVGDTNNFEDIFVFDRSTTTTSRVSVALDGTQANLDSFSPAMNFDGTVIAFDSGASNLGDEDTNGVSDIYVLDTNPVINPGCLADVTSDGVIDGSDFVAFINSFATGDVSIDPIADVNFDGIIDGSDYTDFINAFSAGC